MLDINGIRAQFPALSQNVNNEPLVYLDSAATTQKPQVVIDAITHYPASLKQQEIMSLNLLGRRAVRVLSGLAAPPKR